MVVAGVVVGVHNHLLGMLECIWVSPGIRRVPGASH
jgi:hypothetical protein